MDRINIKGISKLELSEATMVAVMNGLAELPYKTAVPALQEIETQLIAQFAPPPAPKEEHHRPHRRKSTTARTEGRAPPPAPKEDA